MCTYLHFYWIRALAYILLWKVRLEEDLCALSEYSLKKKNFDSHWNWKAYSYFLNSHERRYYTANLVRKIRCFVKSVLTGQKTDMEHRSVFFLVLDNIIWALDLVTMSFSTLQKLGQTWNLFKLVSLVVSFLVLFRLLFHCVLGTNSLNSNM